MDPAHVLATIDPASTLLALFQQGVLILTSLATLDRLLVAAARLFRLEIALRHDMSTNATFQT